MLLFILLAVSVFSRPAQALTSTYVFVPDQSTVVKTGGFAGVHETYAVTGQFRLTVNLDSRIASFEIVDANLIDDTVLEYGQSLNEIFNMTGLAGTVVNYKTIEFEGKTADGTESDVSLSLKLIIKDDSVHLTGKTTPPPNSADMFFYDVNAIATKKYADGTGEPNKPYQIATAEDLIVLGQTPGDYDKHFILTNDIDLDPNLPSRKVFDKAVIAPDTNGTKDYFEGVSFTGAFDGKSHVISNLHIMGGDYMGYLGLFGKLDSGAMVSNLGLEAVNVNGTGDYLGGLVGQNDGSIATSYCTGTVSGHMYFGDYVGGLVGLNYGSIAMSYSTGKVTGRWNVGGLAGSNSGNITKSYTMGTVSGDFQIGGLVGANGVGTITECYSTSTVSGDAGVGGLVGNNWGETTMSYSTGTVNGDTSVGGFVGLNVGKITASYSTSIVTGNVEIGGLVGQNGVNIPTREREGIVFNCYSMGAVTGDWVVGGLVGANRLGNVDMSYSTGLVTDRDPNSLTPPVPPDDPLDPIYKGAGGLVGGNISDITSCFWDIETSGQTTSDGGISKTTVEMQTAATFLDAGWDFVGEIVNGPNDIWWILEGRDYPRIWWERVLDDDFGDGEALPLWQNYEPDPEKIRLVEANGRLEVHANDMADDIVAGYISSGWRLDVTSDFALRADFHFSKIAAGDSWVMLLLLPSLDEPVGRFTVLEAGCIENQPFYLHEIDENGLIIQAESVSRSTDDGTLYISYDSDQDKLYMSYTGYGKANAWQTAVGLLQNEWESEPVYVVIGGGSDRVVLDAGDAYLDNFVIDSGLLDFPAVPDDSGA